MANPTISQIAINGTTYDACDSQARADIKTLQDSVINGTSAVNTSYISLNGIAIDRDGVNPTSTVYGPTIRFLDKDGEWLGTVECSRHTDGTEALRLVSITEKSDSTQHSNLVEIRAHQNGTCSYEVSDPTAFRSAIGAQVAGSYLPLSGGTITGDLQVNGKLKGYTWDLNTNNTTDTWVPVMTGSAFQHRVIPKNIDTAITGISRSGTTFTATRANGTTFTF